MGILYWIVEGAASFIESYMLLVLTGIFLGQKRSKEIRLKEIGIAAGVAFIAYCINSIELVSTLGLVVTFAILVICECTMLNRKFLGCFLVFLVYFTAMTTIDYCSILIMKNLYGISLEMLLAKVSYERLMALVFSKGILIFFVELIHFLSLDFSVEKLKENKAIILAIVVFLGTPMIEIMEYSRHKYVSSFFLLGNLTCITGVIILINYLKKSSQQREQKIALEVQNVKNELLESSLQELEESFASWKTSVHDYKHALLYITMLVQNNRFEELQDYLKIENEKIERKSHYYKTGNSMLDVIINTKEKTMRDKQIDFSVHIDISSPLFIKEKDLGILLGNLLDNAIEAAEQGEKRYVFFSIENSERLLEIELVNSYDTAKKPDFQTTKQDKAFHGIGLQSVKEIVERYDGRMNRELNSDEVIVDVMLLQEENSGRWKR